MEKELLKNIASDQASDRELEKFDRVNSEAWSSPSSTFTDRVMNVLPKPSRLGWHFWGISLGVVLVLVLWGVGGFVTPNVALSYEGFNLGQFDLELTEMTKGFMVANALLLLLFIDRVVQRKRKRFG